MQINKNTGEVLRIKNITGNKITVLIYDNDKEIINKNCDEIIIPDLEKIVHEKLQNFLGEGYTFAENSQNWKCKDKPVRIILETKIILDNLLLDNSLSNLILSKIEENKFVENKFIFKTESLVICYFDRINDDDILLISPYVINEQIEIEDIVI